MENLTFVESTALVVVGDELGYDGLGEGLVMRDRIQHPAEAGDQTEESRCALSGSATCSTSVLGSTANLEHRSLGHSCPFRIHLERVELDENLGTVLRHGLVDLWLKDVDQEFIEKGRQAVRSNVQPTTNEQRRAASEVSGLTRVAQSRPDVE